MRQFCRRTDLYRQDTFRQLPNTSFDAKVDIYLTDLKGPPAKKIFANIFMTELISKQGL